MGTLAREQADTQYLRDDGLQQHRDDGEVLVARLAAERHRGHESYRIGER